jgi:hypothetical protein
MKRFPVGHYHKQGRELIIPGTDLQWRQEIIALRRISACMRESLLRSHPRYKNVFNAESGRGIESESEGKYSVELFKKGGECAGQKEIVDRHHNLAVARAIYLGRVAQYPGRLIMLCKRARVLARSDRPETMP